MPHPAAGQEPPDDATGPLAEFVARLRQAGLDPDARQVCDALWLARWARSPADGPEPQVAGTEQHPGGTGLVASGDGGPARRPRPAAEDRGVQPPEPAPDPEDRAGGPALAPGPGSGTVSLYPVPPADGPRAPHQGPSAALPVGVPAAAVLPAPLELQRALRPLQGYRPPAPPLRRVLDEAATADLSARAGGLVLPVFRGVTKGEACLQLVMDASSSMRVWDRLFDELQQMFAQLGAFWDIQVSYLHQGPDQAPAVSRSPDADAAPLNSADRLSDPTGRRVTLLVSDCAGPLWHGGLAQRLLHRLARIAPTAVLQPLPQRMWRRTRLPVTYGELSRGEGPGATVLRVASRDPAPCPGALPVPVLPPVPRALGAWARLLSGAGAGRVSGAVGWVRADEPATVTTRGGRRPTPLELVSRFRSVASPTAGRLAVYLAAAPLCLPVMQLVQRTMLPGSGPADLAEVLLSGLLSRRKNDSDGGGDDGQWYEFAPGVQDALLGPLGRDEAMLVLKHCSEYIEQRFGTGGPNFPALVLAQLGDSGTARPYAHPLDAPLAEGGGQTLVPQPFAEVAARVLERFMPLPEQLALYGDRGRSVAADRPPHAAVSSARTLLAEFEANGMVQYLIDAVQLLRGAAEHEPALGADPELWSELALGLLRLWQVQGSGELLREARTAAERAAARPGAVRERAVLARVLHEAADDRRRRGDRHGALDLLRRADREYAVACAAPGLEPEEALRLTLERVRALEAQWRLGGDSALLQGAVGMLEAFGDSWPDQERRPASLPLAHGRTLLKLAGATADPEQARAYAEQSAHSLRAALEPEPGTAQGVAADERPRVLLHYADALLRSGGDLGEAERRVGEALAQTREPRLRAQLTLRSGRIRVARFDDTGDPTELDAAAARFAQAARGLPRDAPAHADLLAEWGEVLLRRARLSTGQDQLDHLGQAVRVLRACRSQTPPGVRKLAPRLLLLGRTLMVRYRALGDRVDLREAEHLFGVAANDAQDPLVGAHCWLELGQAAFEAFQSLGRQARLDDAAEAFRAAAEAARRAEESAESGRSRTEAVVLGAQAHHWRGMTYEAAGRPRAARDAYRAAHDEWGRLPDAVEGTGEPTARQTAQRLAELA